MATFIRSENKGDPEDLSLALEFSLTLLFMENDLRAVQSGREKFTTEHNPKLGKLKKYPGYCVYMAYRLDRSTRSSSDIGTVENGVDRVVLETRDGRDIKQGQGEIVSKQYRDAREASMDGVADLDLEDLDIQDPDYQENVRNVLEELEERNPERRIGHLETENSELKERISKLEHSRNWMEERFLALEARFSKEKNNTGSPTKPILENPPFETKKK